MTKPTRPLFCFLCSLVCLSSVWAVDLKDCKEVYQKSSEEILQSYQSKFDGVQQQYQKSLETLKNLVQTQGDLAKTKATIAEIARFHKARCLPATLDGKETPEIKALQSAYVKQYADLERDLTAKLGTLSTKYEQALDVLQKELVKAGKLDDAMAVETERAKVHASVKEYASQFADRDSQMASGGVIPVTPQSVGILSSAKSFVNGGKAKERQEACSMSLRVPAEIVNSIGMKFVLIPPGEFNMGITAEDSKRELEEAARSILPVEGYYASRIPTEMPQHRVKISKPFYLSACEVTQGEYEQIMKNNPSRFSSHVRGSDGKKVEGKDTRRFPVEFVSWDEAVDFSRRLSALPAEAQARRSYRLPTEAEWEYACRADTTTRWFSGDEPASLLPYAWFKANFDGTPHSVGKLRPNAWGLFDMHGNVFEWCADRYATNYYAQSVLVDPQGPSEGSYRVARGGNFSRHPYGCRSAYRGIGNAPPWPVRANLIGFRVAFGLEPGGTPASAEGLSKERAAPTPAVEPERAAVERLKQTKQLYEQGLISKEDYDKKMKAIMDSL